MRKITNILLSVVVFGFVGCTDSDTTVDNPELDTSVIPEKQLEGSGLEYDITSYFFPSKVITYKDYTVTTKSADGYFDTEQRVINHYIEDNKNTNDESVITVFQNDEVVKRSVIGGSIITETTYDVNGNEIREYYSKIMHVNDDLIRNESGACVLKQKFESFYIGTIIPAQADPHNSPTHYNSVLHFYCGTSNGTKIDRYYADAWGEIAEIYEYSDGSMQYVVFDKNTDQNP